MMAKFTVGAFAPLLGCVVGQSAFAAPINLPDGAASVGRVSVSTSAPGVSNVRYSQSGADYATSVGATLGVAGGAVYASRAAAIGLGHGASLPVTVRGAITSQAAAGYIKKAVMAIGSRPIPIGLALLAVELGYELSKTKDGSGVIVTKVTTETFCQNGVCLEYYNGVPPPQWFNTLGGAFSSFLAFANASTGPYRFNASGCDLPSGRCQYEIVRKADGGIDGVDSWKPTTREVPAYDAQKREPSDAQHLADDIAHRSGWPDSSAIAQGLSDAQPIVNEPLPVSGPTVSGPSTVKGQDETTTKPNATGGTTTTTNSTKYTCKYVDGPVDSFEGGSVSCAEETTTTETNRTVDPVTGNPTTTTSTTATTTKPVDTTAQEKKESEAAPTDTTLPAAPKLYERKYPDGLTGVWKAQKDTLLGSPLAQLPKSLQPTIAGAGGYPSFVIPVVIGKWNFGTYDVSPANYVWDFIKLCVLISAGFLCRALIFGG